MLAFHNHYFFAASFIIICAFFHDFCVWLALTRMRIMEWNCRVQSLKFKTEEQSDLNDILLRVSAFGLFTYAVFSVIAGSLNAFTKEPNLLVMITGILSVAQVSERDYYSFMCGSFLFFDFALCSKYQGKHKFVKSI